MIRCLADAARTGASGARQRVQRVLGLITAGATSLQSGHLCAAVSVVRVLRAEADCVEADGEVAVARSALERPDRAARFTS